MRFGERRKPKNAIKIALAVLALGTIFGAESRLVKADEFSISHTQITLLKGAQKKLKLSNLPSETAKVKWKTSNKFAATVSKKGKVTAVNYGVATIQAVCKKKKVSCQVTVPDTSGSVQLNVYTLALAENSEYQLQAVSQKKVKYHSTNKDIATVDSAGKIYATNPGTTVIVAKSSRGIARCTVKVTSGDVNVASPSWIGDKKAVAIRRYTKNNNYVYDNITWAKSKEITFKIANLDESKVKKCVWSSGDTNILSNPKADSDCKIKAVASTVEAGMTTITATVTDTEGKVKMYTNNVYVSNPQINTKTLALLGSVAGNNRQQFVSFSGLSRYSKITWTNSNVTSATLLEYRTKAAAWGLKTGSGTITASVDGKTYNVAYTVCEPKFGKNSFYLAAGKTKQIQIAQIFGITPTYTSRNKSVAKVSKEGLITAKKAGVTYIDVSLGAMVYTYRVEVAAKGVKTIINRAKYILKNWKYDQGKRMKDGYYDCSALVWKGYQAYKNYNKKLGNETSALPAGELFDYLYSKNQIVYFGYMNIDDMKPGDLIFYGDYDNAVKYSTPGRTLDIYHVSMYAGMGKIVEIGDPSIDGSNSKYIVGIGRVIKD